MLSTHPSVRPVSRLRLAACYGTLAACVPYLTLKVLWLAGVDVGLDSEAAGLMHSTKFKVANAVTMGLESVAVLIAFTFTYPFGRRIPACLVLGPMWAGTGLLAPIALGAPLGILVQAAVGGSPLPDNDDGHMSGWIFPIVYGGFTLQAITLTTAFVLHARERWPHFFTMRLNALTRSPSPGIVNGAAIAAVVCGAAQLAWAFGGPALGGDPGFETAAQRTFVGVGGALAFVGAAGTLALARRRNQGRLLVPLIAAWLGTGHLVAWGLFAPTTGGLSGAVHILGAITGLALAATTVHTLRPHRAQRLIVESPGG